MKEYIKLYQGKLLLENELVLSDKEIETFIQKRYLKRHPSVKRGFLMRFICMRCDNKKREMFAITPCYKCKLDHYYCRKCIRLGKVMECNFLYEWIGPVHRWQAIPKPLTWNGTLTNQQRKVSDVLIQVVEEKAEHLIWAVTGSGKTEMLFPCIEKAIMLQERVCIATPRADVVRELFPRIQEAFAKCHVQALYGGSRDKDGSAQIIIATTHQLMRYYHAFDVMIIDEVDAFPYHKDTSLKFVTERAKKVKAATIYLTATPRRAQLLHMRTRELSYSFVPLRFHHHLIPRPSLQYSSHVSKDVERSILPKKLKSWFPKRLKKARQILIFVPTIIYGEEIEKEVAGTLLENGMIFSEDEVAVVTSSDPLREEKIVQFRERKLYCLITTTILERGVTFPSIDVAVIQANHDVFDEQALVQITGRVGRAKHDPTGEVLFLYDGKTNAMVRALQMIETMNKEAEKILRNEED